MKIRLNAAARLLATEEKDIERMKEQTRKWAKMDSVPEDKLVEINQEEGTAKMDLDGYFYSAEKHNGEWYLNGMRSGGG